MQKDIFKIPAVGLGQLIKVKVSHTGSDWLLDKVVVMETEADTALYVFECGKCLNEGLENGREDIVLPLTDIVDKTPPPIVEAIVSQGEEIPKEEQPRTEAIPQEMDDSILYAGRLRILCCHFVSFSSLPNKTTLSMPLFEKKRHVFANNNLNVA